MASFDRPTESATRTTPFLVFILEFAVSLPLLTYSTSFAAALVLIQGRPSGKSPRLRCKRAYPQCVRVRTHFTHPCAHGESLPVFLKFRIRGCLSFLCVLFYFSFFFESREIIEGTQTSCDVRRTYMMKIFTTQIICQTKHVAGAFNINEASFSAVDSSKATDAAL